MTEIPLRICSFIVSSKSRHGHRRSAGDPQEARGGRARAVPARAVGGGAVGRVATPYQYAQEDPTAPLVGASPRCSAPAMD
jgi:hypothetical protein